MKVDKQIAEQVLNHLITVKGVDPNTLDKDLASLSPEERDEFILDGYRRISQKAPEAPSPISGPDVKVIKEKGDPGYEELSPMESIQSAAASFVNESPVGRVGRRLTETYEAGVQTLTEPKSLVETRSFKQRFQDNWKAIVERNEQNLSKAERVQPGIQTLSGIAGYVADPLMNKLGPISGAVLGPSTKGSVDYVMKVAQGMDSKQALKEELSNTAVESGSMIAGYGLLKGAGALASKTARTKPIQWLAERAKPSLTKADQAVIEYSDKIASVFKNPKDAAKQMPELKQDLARRLVEAQQVVNKSLPEDIRSANPLLDQEYTTITGLLKNQADEIASVLKKERPRQEELIGQVQKLSNLFKNYSKIASNNFERELDDISGLVPADAKLDFKSPINGFFEKLTSLGIGDTKGGKFVLSQADTGKYGKVADLLNQLNKAENVNFKEGSQLVSKLGNLVSFLPDDKLGNADVAVKQLWKDLVNTLQDQNVLGDLAPRYTTLRSSYAMFKEGLGEVDAASKFFTKDLEKATPEAFLKRLNDVVKATESEATQEALNKNAMGIFTEPEKQILNTFLRDAKQAIKFEKDTSTPELQKTLFKIYKGKSADADKEIVNLISKLDRKNKYNTLLEQKIQFEQIRKAFTNPNSKEARSKAVSYIEKYGAGRKNVDELNSLLNRSAHYQRFSGLKNINAENVLKFAKKQGLASEEELLEAEIAMRLEPGLADVITNMNLAENYIKADPSIIKTLIPNAGKDLITAAGLYGATQLTPGDDTLPVACAFGLYRLYKNPTALKMFSSRLNKAIPGMSEKTFQKYTRAIQFASRAIGIWSSTKSEKQSSQ